jgi:putative ABC transport system permease protein
MALGAQPAGLVWLFVRRGLVLAVVGASAGLLASYFVLSFIQRTVPAFPGNDITMAVGISCVFVATAAVACWVPALKAARVDPVRALRAD